MSPEATFKRFRIVRTEDKAFLGWISRGSREAAEKVMDQLWPGGGWRLDLNEEDQDS